MARLARIGLIILGVVVVLIGGAVLLLKSDVPRRIAEQQASKALNRAVTIGDLDIALRWPPRVVVKDVKVANMEGGTAANMVEVARAEAVLNGSALLRGELDVPYLQLDEPRVVAEKNAAGKANWQLDRQMPASEAAPNFPIHRLVVNNGWVTYRDATVGADVVVAVDTAPAEAAGGERLHIVGQGKIRGTPIAMTGAVDPLGGLGNKEHPYGFDLDARAGATRTRLAGTLTEPLRADGLAAEVQLEATDAADLYQLTGITVPPAPPYRLRGKLQREGAAWRLDPFEARVGKSDLRGRVSAAIGGDRPRVTAALESKQLDIVNLMGADPGASGVTQAREGTQARQAAGAATRPPPPPVKASDRVLPDTPLPFDKLRVADVQLKLRADRVNAPVVPINKVETELTLENGVLRVAPLRFAIGQGTADLVLVLDARQNPPAYEAALSLVRIPFDEVLRSVERTLAQNQTSAGTLGGRIEIRGNGASLHAMLASADGHLGLAHEQGRIGLLLIELVDLDAGEALGILAAGNKPVPIRCAISEFDFIDGTMGSRIFVIDTTDTNITGEGAIKFKTEEIFFRFVPQPKDTTILSGRSPVRIEGTLSDPKVRIETAGLIARLGVATVLGVALTPFAVPLAFVDIGLGKDSDCAGLVQEVRRRIKEDERDAPKPGRQNEPAAGAPR